MERKNKSSRKISVTPKLLKATRGRANRIPGVVLPIPTVTNLPGREDLVAYAESGFKISEVAAELGVSRDLLSRHIREVYPEFAAVSGAVRNRESYAAKRLVWLQRLADGRSEGMPKAVRNAIIFHMPSYFWRDKIKDLPKSLGAVSDIELFRLRAKIAEGSELTQAEKTWLYGEYHTADPAYLRAVLGVNEPEGTNEYRVLKHVQQVASRVIKLPNIRIGNLDRASYKQVAGLRRTPAYLDRNVYIQSIVTKAIKANPRSVKVEGGNEAVLPKVKVFLDFSPTVRRWLGAIPEYSIIGRDLVYMDLRSDMVEIARGVAGDASRIIEVEVNTGKALEFQEAHPEIEVLIRPVTFKPVGSP